MPRPSARTLLQTMQFPRDISPPVDPRALVEALGEQLRASSITGSQGQYELRLVSPAGLVVAIDAAAARFYGEKVRTKSVDIEHGTPLPEEDVLEAIDDAVAALETLLGLASHEEEGEGEEAGGDQAPAPDRWDEVAERFVGSLIEQGLLELTTPRSRSQVEARVANSLAHGRRRAGDLVEVIVACKGVAELLASDDDTEKLLDQAGLPRPDQR